MEKTAKEKKLKVTSIRITEELCNQIDTLAKEQNRTRNEQISFMLKQYIEIMKKF